MHWNHTTALTWKKVFAEHPEAMLFPCDIAKTETVGQLLQHIVAVELRYAERLAGREETPYEKVPYDSFDAMFATHELAMALYREVMTRENYAWEEEIEFQTRSLGRMSATRRAVIFHALLHSVRHYGQLATVMRQNGVPVQWPMDFLFVYGKFA